MQASDVPRAIAAATSIAAALGLTVADAVVLQEANKLTLRLLPCDVFARVALGEFEGAEFEVDLAQRLAAAGCPVAALDGRAGARVFAHDGFAVTLWTYYEPATAGEVAPAEYAGAMARLHAGMRTLDLPTPHFLDRVAEAQRLVMSRDRTPALADADRTFLADALRRLRHAIVDRGAAEQILHGEPHPGNLLNTKDGLRFIDFETCCRGPVEFDVAHAPEAVGAHYPGIDHALLRECRLLVLAMITTWRWDRDDHFPDGPGLGREWLGQLRAALDRGELTAQG